VLFCGAQNLVDWLLDSDVYCFETVVAQNDVDQVLADVVNVSPDRRQENSTLAAVVCFFNVRLEVRNRGLHNFGRLQNKRKLHFSATEEFAYLLHALEQVFVDDLQRTLAGMQRLIEI
jgi:hypothetical protein